MADFVGVTWDLENIIGLVRSTTGRPDPSQLSDQDIVDHINHYYQFVLPKELKIFFGYTYYNFLTIPNIAEYTPPANFQTVNPVVYSDGWQMDWYLSPDLFFQDYPIEINKEVNATGDGITTNYNFVTSAFPILQGTYYVTDGIQTATGTTSTSSIGTFTGDATGTINYLTGSVNITWNTPPAANSNITSSYQTYIPARPQGFLYYNKVFTLRNVPDTVYQIKMEGINIPLPLLNLTDVPFRPDLGPLIAYGASLAIYWENNQTEQYDELMQREYTRYKDVSMADTYEEYLYQRSTPTF